MTQPAKQKSISVPINQKRPIFIWSITFLLQRLVFRRGEVNQLENKTGMKLQDIIHLVENDILKSRDSTELLISGFIGMGGKNNVGMLVHVCAISGRPLYVSKLARHDLVDREHKFLVWHKQYIKEAESISPNMIVFGNVNQSGISYLVTGYLHHPRHYSVADIVALYEKLSFLTPRVNLIDGAGEQDGLPIFQIKDDTRIKAVIARIVTRLHTTSAFDYALDYLQQRKDAFTGRNEEYEQLVACIRDLSMLAGDVVPSRYYGLIHGDFKKQNILCDEEGQLRLIDLQYYNYGASLWDLAFYFSKEKESFTRTYSRLVEQISLDRTENWIFLFLYMIAALLHVEQSNIEKTLTYKIRPALKILDEHKQE